MKHKLTKTHFEQIKICINKSVEDGSYYGRKDHFLKRHSAIMAWLEDMINNEYLEK